MGKGDGGGASPHDARSPVHSPTHPTYPAGMSEGPSGARDREEEDRDVMQADRDLDSYSPRLSEGRRGVEGGKSALQ